LVLSKHYERNRAIEQELREKKIPAYYEFVELWFSIVASRSAEEGEEAAEQSKQRTALLMAFTQKVLVWGSDDVVAKWSRLRRRFGRNEPFSQEMLFEFEQLLLAMRLDTGHANKRLKRGDLLGLFINDIDNLLEKDIKSDGSEKVPVVIPHDKPPLPFAAFRRK
jgi:hypothetical protein